MKKILFVDDELNILQGLKRMLRPMRHEWDMEFASSGQEALDILAKNSFDVVVSDMRMPGMDGSKLLSIVMKKHPECVRIILSGHSDNEMILDSVNFAHQYLMKPCEADVVKTTINRACNLRDLLENEALRKIASGMENLPSLPKSYNLIIEEMRTPEPSLRKVGNIIARDVSMSARVLQLVNSAFFGLPQKILNPQQAVIYLGVETLKALVLSTHVFSSFKETSELLDFSLPKLCNHSMAVGSLAREIIDGETVEQRLKEEALVAGLLHDLGKLLMLNIPDELKQIQELNSNTGCGILAAEYKVLNTSHAELGAYLLGLWGLPAGIVESIAFHHHPSRLIGNTFLPVHVSSKASEDNSGQEELIDSKAVSTQSNSINVNGYSTLTAVHVANALMNQEDISSDTTDFKYIDMRYLRALNLVEKLPEWVECCNKIRQRGG